MGAMEPSSSWDRDDGLELEHEPLAERAVAGDALPALRSELLGALDRLVARAVARSSDPRMREAQSDALYRAALALGGLVRELVAVQALLESERDGRILLSLVVETEHALAEAYGAGGGERAAALAVQLGAATRNAFHPCVGIDWSGGAPAR
jgi:hypothetical protein